MPGIIQKDGRILLDEGSRYCRGRWVVNVFDGKCGLCNDCVGMELQSVSIAERIRDQAVNCLALLGMLGSRVLRSDAFELTRKHAPRKCCPMLHLGPIVERSKPEKSLLLLISIETIQHTRDWPKETSPVGRCSGVILEHLDEKECKPWGELASCIII